MNKTIMNVPCFSDAQEDQLVQFERAWEQCHGATLPDPRLFRGTNSDLIYLKELALIDLERRARAGLPCLLESCLESLPELTADDSILIELLAAERSLRHRYGLPIEPGEYTRRFPLLANRLPACEVVSVNTTPQPVEVSAVYDCIRIHATGGLGDVVLAEDRELHRRVALKVLQTRWANEPRAVRDFLIEAEITSQLEHPGIVSVHGVGRTPDGRPCYSMRFVEGETLRTAISRYHEEEKKDPKKERLVLRHLLGRFVAVCNTIAYAHSRGVVHRDLKPENMMLGKFGETVVLDWGLARTGQDVDVSQASLIQPTADPTETPTLPGEVRGTLAYLSPEQARGERDRIGPATDLFGLGATLYTLLTNQPPYCRGTFEDLLGKAKICSFAAPRVLDRSIPPALEAICVKAMAALPEKRYGSAQALAADVENWLADESVRAWREPWWMKMRRELRRRRTPYAVLLALMIVIPLALGLGSYFVGREHARTQEERRIADLKERTTNELSDILVRMFRTSDPIALEGSGFRELSERGDSLNARTLLERGALLIRERMKDQPLARAALLDAIGNSYRNLGVFDKAEELLEESHRIRRETLSAESGEIALSLHNKGRLAHDRGEYDKAEKFYRSALALRTKRYGSDHLLTARTKFYLAWVLVHQPFTRAGSEKVAAEEAERLLLETLATREKHLPAGDRDIALTLAALAAVRFTENSRRVLAMADAVRALEMLRAGEGKSAGFGSTILTYVLAEQNRKAKRYDEAAECFKRVLAMSKRQLDPSHPLILMQLGNLAGLYRQKGDLVTGERYIREALHLARPLPFRSLPIAVDALKQLADLVSQRDRKEAESLYREALRYARERPEANAKIIPELEQRIQNLKKTS